MVAAEALDEADQLHMVLNDSVSLRGIDKIGAHPPAIGNGFQTQAAPRQLVLQALRIVGPAFYVIPEGLDAAIAGRRGFVDGADKILCAVPIRTSVDCDANGDAGLGGGYRLSLQKDG